MLLVGLILLFTSVTLGCWDQDEITSLASVTGLGIDIGSKPGFIRVTVQISPPTAGSAGAGGGASGGSLLRVVTVEAESLVEGFALLQSHLRREPFFLHLNYVVFGEELARSGIGGVIGGLQGWTQIRGSVLVFVAQGTAESALSAHSGIGRAPGQDISDLVANISNAPVARKVSVNDVVNTLTSKGSELGISIIELTPLRLESGDDKPPDGTSQSGGQFQEILISRLALFKRDRWVATLDEFETQTLVLLLGESRQGVGTLPNPQDPEGFVAPVYESFSVGYSISVTDDGLFQLAIKPELEVRLLEVRGMYDLKTRGFEPIEQAVESDTESQIRLLMQRLQQVGIDALGVGQRISRTKPGLWKEVEERWDETYPTVQIEVQSKARIRTTGLIKKFFELRR